MSQYHDLQMTGPELDDRLAQVLTNEQAIGEETEARQQADQTLQGNIDAKANVSDVYTKTEADDTIDAAVMVEKTRAEGAEAQLDNQIVFNDAELSLVADPDIVKLNVGANITFVAESSVAAHIVIMQGAHIIKEGDGTSLSTTHALIPEALGVTTFIAIFTKNGLSRAVTKDVYSVSPALYGAGATYAAAVSEKIVLDPKGKYNITASAGDYIWLCIPASMTIDQVLMGSVEMQFNEPDTTTLAGYKIYRSTEAYQAGTYEIEIV
jgi:plastocyanin